MKQKNIPHRQTASIKTLTALCCLLLLTVCLPVRAQGERIILGNERTSEYYPLLRGKRVALFGNHTSLRGNRHLLDCLLADSIRVVAVFSPEHGFRGNADAGEKVGSSVDSRTGVPILSLYDGKDKRPSAASMKKFDVLLADIQDVGLRFYTYYITLCRLMDACAEYGKSVIVLDRPNPNGHYVDGPLLDMKYKSGVGWLPIPVVHGMTLGELARMVNGEGWLPAGRTCRLTVVPCLNYTHQTRYDLPVPPSPNLPNMKAIYLYPSLCPFEGTVVDAQGQPLTGVAVRVKGENKGVVTDINGRFTLNVEQGKTLVLSYIGYSNQEIAQELFISKRTVDKHRANILEKTGCRNTASLVIWAIRHSLIEI